MRYVFINITFLGISLYAARPFSTDDAPTVPQAGYELEAGYDSGEDIFGFSFKHGLTQKMDIGIEFGYTTLSLSKNGFTPAELCLKYAIIPETFSVSIGNELGTSSYDLNAIFTKTLKLIEIDANLGYSIPVPGEKGLAFYALAMIAGFDKFDIGGEILGNEDKIEGWLSGGRYKIFDCLNFDFGISGKFKDKNKITGTFGLHYEF